MRVVLLSPIWPESIVQLRIGHTVECVENSSATDLAARVSQAEAVVLRSGVEMDRSLIENSHNLKLIIRAGAGLDNIDLQAARQRSMRVISIPLSADAVAEHIYALALGLGHHLLQHHQTLTRGKWEKHGSHIQSLFDRQLGLIGFGRIGQRAAELGRAFHMDVVAYDRSPEKVEKQAAAEASQVRFVDLPTLLAEADVVSVQTPRNAASRHLIDAKALTAMKRDAMLINVGRGGVIDERALYDALSQQQIAGAALDVFDPEPPTNSPLFTLPNFLGTPHVAAQSVQAQSLVGQAVVQIINAFASKADISPFGNVII